LVTLLDGVAMELGKDMAATKEKKEEEDAYVAPLAR